MADRLSTPRWTRLALLAGLALPTGAVHAAESPLGRLFYTPAERRQLDEMRRLGPRTNAAPRSALRLDGLVRHPDGRTTVWINGEPAPAHDVQPQRAPGKAAIRTGSGKGLILGVGDQLSTERDTLAPLVPGGQIRRGVR
ncbi:MAG: hypothetical protein JNJ44_00835 [Zoogloeaceae bacterium]|nr:hypothetical protein [Zoogloeaceae bacterium]